MKTIKGKTASKGMRSDTSARVAQEGFRALLRVKSFHVVGTDNYLQSLLPRWLPRKTVINLVGGYDVEKGGRLRGCFRQTTPTRL